MAERRIVEHVEMDAAERWGYYRRYYEAASAFYGAHDTVVDEAEVDRCIREFKPQPLPGIRRSLPLTEWRFSLDEPGDGLRREYYSRAHDESRWQAVHSPHSINHVPADPVRFGSTQYPMLVSREKRWDIWRAEYTCWYKARIEAPRVSPSEVAYLRFESVNLLSDVWVNDDPVMLDHLGLFPFQMEVTEELEARTGSEALVSLRVRNHATNTPYLFYNGLQIAYGRPPWSNATVPLDTIDASWAGIAGDAHLEIMDRRHLEDAFLVTEKLNGRRAHMCCRVEVRNETWSRFSGSVRIELSPWLPREDKPRVAAVQALSVRPMGDQTVEIRFHLDEAPRWSVDTPNLHLAHVVLLDNAGQPIDDLYRTFGVRTIEIEGTHFLLNGERIVPRGTHDLSNYHGDSLICPSDRAIVKDILLHKGMNAVCSRWPSDMRMHYPRIAEYADQLGYMISWTGYFEMWNIHPEAEVYMRRDARAMVRGLRNHPSIIIWEMGDEPLMLIHPARRWRWYELITDVVEAEDRSRPIIPAGAWCNEIVDLVEKHPEQALTLEARRAKVMEDFPLLGRDQIVWDYHYCPYHPGTPDIPTWHVVTMVKKAYGRARPAIFTEFGVDGMPRFENVKHIYGEFRWKGSAMMPVDRTKSDVRYYGRAVGQGDWKETQASQAITMAAIIGQLRESPEDFAGYYMVTLVDPWTFTWGVVDAAWNAKLAYFVVAGCYGRAWVSALHGSARIERSSAPLSVTASVYGGAVKGASLSVKVKDQAGSTARAVDITRLDLPAHGVNVTAATVEVADLPPGTYSIEHELKTRDGGTLARLLELFILR